MEKRNSGKPRRTRRSKGPKPVSTKRRKASTPKKVQASKRPSRSRRTQYGSRFLAFFLFGAMIIYICGSLVTFFTKTKTPVEIAQFGTIELPKVYQGLIVRDETVYKSNKAGEITYDVLENDRVKKGELICAIKDTGATTEIEKQLTDIDSNILSIQNNRSDFSLFKDEIKSRNVQIKEIINNSIPNYIELDIANVYSLKAKVQKNIEIRNQMLLTENKGSLKNLVQEKFTYEQDLAKNISAMRTNESGIVSFQIDGLEDTLKTDKLDNIVDEQLKMKVDTEGFIQKKICKEAEPVFKIVNSNNWYIISILPIEKSANLKEGENAVLYIKNQDQLKPLEVNVEKVKTTDKDCTIYFKVTRDMTDYLNVRNISFEIDINTFNGIKIPNTSIVERTLLKIPSQYVIDNGDAVGVYKKLAEGSEFIPTSILIKDDDEKNVYVLQDLQILKLGDELILSKDDKNTPYQIKDIKTSKGVYVVNSGIAKFKSITSIAENKDYSIIKVEDMYGVKLYDRIVSDSKNVEENQIVN